MNDRGGKGDDGILLMGRVIQVENSFEKLEEMGIAGVLTANVIFGYSVARVAVRDSTFFGLPNALPSGATSQICFPDQSISLMAATPEWVREVREM